MFAVRWLVLGVCSSAGTRPPAGRGFRRGRREPAARVSEATFVAGDLVAGNGGPAGGFAQAFGEVALTESELAPAGGDEVSELVTDAVSAVFITMAP